MAISRKIRAIRTPTICSCLRDVQCQAYEYTEPEPGKNCLLIYKNSTHTEGQRFEIDEHGAIYERGLEMNIFWSNVTFSVLVFHSLVKCHSEYGGRYCFTDVCHPFCPRAHMGVWSESGVSGMRGCLSGGGGRPPPSQDGYSTIGTHSTEIHSCQDNMFDDNF